MIICVNWVCVIQWRTQTFGFGGGWVGVKIKKAVHNLGVRGAEPSTLEKF